MVSPAEEFGALGLDKPFRCVLWHLYPLWTYLSVLVLQVWMRLMHCHAIHDCSSLQLLLLAYLAPRACECLLAFCEGPSFFLRHSLRETLWLFELIAHVIFLGVLILPASISLSLSLTYTYNYYRHISLCILQLSSWTGQSSLWYSVQFMLYSVVLCHPTFIIVKLMLSAGWADLHQRFVHLSARGHLKQYPWPLMEWTLSHSIISCQDISLPRSLPHDKALAASFSSKGLQWPGNGVIVCCVLHRLAVKV